MLSVANHTLILGYMIILIFILLITGFFVPITLFFHIMPKFLCWVESTGTFCFRNGICIPFFMLYYRLIPPIFADIFWRSYLPWFREYCWGMIFWKAIIIRMRGSLFWGALRMDCFPYILLSLFHFLLFHCWFIYAADLNIQEKRDIICFFFCIPQFLTLLFLVFLSLHISVFIFYIVSSKKVPIQKKWSSDWCFWLWAT